MSHAFIIEIDDESVGIVARDEGGFRFFAASHVFDALEGRIFHHPRHAEKAARAIAAARNPRRISKTGVQQS